MTDPIADRPRAIDARLVVAVWPAAVAVLIVWLVYGPITGNFFFTDDFFLLQDVVNARPLELLLRPQAGHVCLVRNLVAYLSFAVFGPNPVAWYGTVLLTHLANVALVVTLLRRLTGYPGLAAFGGALWGACPALEATLGWYSVYGQVLATTAMLIVLVRLAGHGRSDRPVSSVEAAGWEALLLGGALSFGIGVGVGVAFPAIGFLLLPPARFTRRARGLVLAGPALVIGVYLAVHVLYGRWYVPGTEGTPLGLLGLLADWRHTLLMWVHLLGAGTAATLGFVVVPVSAYPGSTSLALIGAFAAALAAGLIVGPEIVRRRLLAMLVLTCTVYGVIAAGRAPIAGVARNLQVLGATCTRYHYTGALGVTVLLCLLVARVAGLVAPPARALVCTGAVATLLVAWTTSSWVIDAHDDARQQTAAVLHELEVARQAIPTGPLFVDNRRFPPAVVDVLFAGRAAVYTIFVREDRERPVYFLERDARTFALAPPGSRLAQVLVRRTD